MFDQPPDDPNPTYRRKRTDFNAPKPNEMAAKQEEQLRDLERIQAERPRRPPGVGR